MKRALVLCGLLPAGGSFAQDAPLAVPSFKVDPAWPKQMPDKWLVGAVAGVAVDGEDHIWVIHRPGTLQPNETRAGWKAAPPNERGWIIDRESLKIVGQFGGGGHWAGQFYGAHNIAADSQGNVFITESYEGKRIQKFPLGGFTDSPRDSVAQAIEIAQTGFARANEVLQSLDDAHRAQGIGGSGIVNRISKRFPERRSRSVVI